MRVNNDNFCLQCILLLQYLFWEEAREVWGKLDGLEIPPPQIEPCCGIVAAEGAKFVTRMIICSSVLPKGQRWYGCQAALEWVEVFL